MIAIFLGMKNILSNIETYLGKEPTIKYFKHVMFFLQHCNHFSHSGYLEEAENK